MTTLFEAALKLEAAGASAQTAFETAETYDYTDTDLVVSNDDFATWTAARSVAPEMNGDVAIFDERKRFQSPSHANRSFLRGNVIYVAEFQDEAGDTKTLSYVESY